jgi:hypothetical protein
MLLSWTFKEVGYDGFIFIWFRIGISGALL